MVAAGLVSLLPSLARAQTVEITPLAGYRFGGSLSVAAGDAAAGTDLEVDDAAAFGAQLGLGIGSSGELELLYSRENSRLQTAGLFTAVPVFDLDLETWQLCGNYLFGEGDARVRPYVGVGLGRPGAALLSRPTELASARVLLLPVEVEAGVGGVGTGAETCPHLVADPDGAGTAQVALHDRAHTLELDVDLVVGTR